MSNSIYPTTKYDGLPEAFPTTTDDATDAIYIARPDALPKDRRLPLKHLTPQGITLTANTATSQALDLDDHNTDLTVTVTGTYTGESFSVALTGSLPIGRTLTVITDTPFRRVALTGLASHTGAMATYGSLKVSFGEDGTVGTRGDGPGTLQRIEGNFEFQKWESGDADRLKQILQLNTPATITLPHGTGTALGGLGELALGSGPKRIILPLDEASTFFPGALTIQGYSSISGLLHVEGKLVIDVPTIEILTPGVSAKYLDAKTITGNTLTYEYLLAGNGSIQRKTPEYTHPLRTVAQLPDNPQLWHGTLGGIVYASTIVGTWTTTFPATGSGFNPSIGDKIELYVAQSTTIGTPSVTISTESPTTLNAPISYFPMENGAGGYDYSNAYGPIKGTLIFRGANQWAVQNGMPLTPNLYNNTTNNTPSTTAEWMGVLGGLYYRLTGGGAVNLTLPMNIPHATPGAWVDIFPGSGAGISITPAAGVTINGGSSTVNSDVGKMNRLICVASNEWIYTKP